MDTSCVRLSKHANTRKSMINAWKYGDKREAQIHYQNNADGVKISWEKKAHTFILVYIYFFYHWIWLIVSGTTNFFPKRYYFVKHAPNKSATETNAIKNIANEFNNKNNNNNQSTNQPISSVMCCMRAVCSLAPSCHRDIWKSLNNMINQIWHVQSKLSEKNDCILVLCDTMIK